MNWYLWLYYQNDTSIALKVFNFQLYKVDLISMNKHIQTFKKKKKKKKMPNSKINKRIKIYQKSKSVLDLYLSKASFTSEL